TGLLTATTIELLQLGIPGRESSLGDVITNTAGAFVGMVVYSSWRVLLFPASAHARRFAVGASVLWLVMALGTMWCFEPAPSDRTYYGQWAPEDVYPATFRGLVYVARAGALIIPTGRIPDSAPLRRQLSASSSDIRVTECAGALTEDLASIVSVADDRHKEILLIGQKGTTLIFRTRMRASELRLRNFGVVVSGALGDSGKVVEIEARRSSATLDIRAAVEQTFHQRFVPLTPRLGWTLFAPFSP